MGFLILERGKLRSRLDYIRFILLPLRFRRWGGGGGRFATGCIGLTKLFLLSLCLVLSKFVEPCN
jgi:hypothetical protein